MRILSFATALVTLLVVFAASAAPNWGRRTESAIPVNEPQCMARAVEALRAEGFAPTQNVRHVWGSKGERWTVVICNPGPSGQTWVNIVSSAPPAEADAHYADHERVGRRMGESSTTTAGPGGRILTVRVGARAAVLMWTSSGSSSWVSVVPTGTPDGQHTGRWIYTRDYPSKSWEAAQIPPGEYEARYYGDGGYDKILDRVRFTIR